MSKQIKTENETIQYLSDTSLLREFILELQEYLKIRLEAIVDNHGQVRYACECDPHADDIHDRKKHFIRFCNKKGLSWGAANKLLFDDMSSFLCDCDLLNDLMISENGEIIFK